MKKTLLFALILFLNGWTMRAGNIISVKLDGGTAGQCLRDAFEKAASYQGSPVTIQLSPGIYRIPREDATVRKYYVSNTCSEQECPDPQKHIALLLRHLKNVTVDGRGATILLDGEMTAFVIDSCQNILFKDLKIDNAHPTQVEMEVVEDGKDYMKCKVHPTSQYRIVDGQLEWYGKGWAFRKGIAQMYDPKRDMTWRSWSPMDNLCEVKELAPHSLYLRYSKKQEVPVGTVFQIRDGIRDEVCGLINRSRNVRFEDVHFCYLGNFGVVSQTSEDIFFNHCRFAPEQGSGRTNAGFADMMQFSGCKGTIRIENSYFAGAHDDPINIHGTHLQVTKVIDRSRLRLRYMHPQTYGFQSFFPGDSIEIVNPETLLPVYSCLVKSAKMVTPREIEITLTQPLDRAFVKLSATWVVENTTWTPQVYLAHNYFCRIPTRGILVTTRRKTVIEHNTFYGTQMSGILVADDGKSWFESGPVHQLTIRRNTFIKCGSPVILIAPETGSSTSPVHRNISIRENVFEMASPSSKAISAACVEGLSMEDNFVEYPSSGKQADAIEYKNCTHVLNKNNRIE